MTDFRPRLTDAEAIETIRRYAQAGTKILGVDGFEVVPSGVIAHIDLILDLSDTDMTVSDSAKEAEAFVVANAGDKIIWEVCADVP